MSRSVQSNSPSTFLRARECQESDMSINIGPPAIDELRPRIVVIGVGGAGGNAIANMIEAQIEGVDFVVANTDAQALNNSIAETRVQLGPEDRKSTRLNYSH